MKKGNASKRSKQKKSIQNLHQYSGGLAKVRMKEKKDIYKSTLKYSKSTLIHNY